MSVGIVVQGKSGQRPLAVYQTSLFSLVPASAEFEMAGGEADKDSGKPKTKVDSCFQSASLKLSVAGIQGHLKSLTNTHGCSNTTAAVHSTAILD